MLKIQSKPFNGHIFDETRLKATQREYKRNYALHEEEVEERQVNDATSNDSEPPRSDVEANVGLVSVF